MHAVAATVHGAVDAVAKYGDVAEWSKALPC